MFEKIRSLSNWSKFYIILIVVFFTAFVLPIVVTVIMFLFGKGGIKVL